MNKLLLILSILFAMIEVRAASSWDENVTVPGSMLTYDGSSQEKAIRIAKASDLAWVALQVNKGLDSFKGKYLILTKDIDLANSIWVPIGYKSAEFPEVNFEGYFDGRGYVIKNLTIDETEGSYVGLFGVVGSPESRKAIVCNLGIESGIIENKKGVGTAAGVVGVNYGTVYNCFNQAVVTSTDRAGGVVGYNYTKVENCWNSGRITGTGNNARVGGVVAHNYGTSNYASVVNHCYNTGLVSSTSSLYEGAVIGQNSTIGTQSGNFWLTETCSQGMGRNTTEGQVFPIEKSESAMKSATFVEDLNASQDSIHWVSVTDGYPALRVVIPVEEETTPPAEMASWSEHASAPTTLAEFDGSAPDKAIQITSGAELAWVAKQVNSSTDIFTNKYIVLVNDIDLAGYRWEPIGYKESSAGTDYFDGHFDGQGYKIQNMYIYETLNKYTGLFGFAGKDKSSTVVIQNVGIESGLVYNKRSSSGYCGGIAGTLYGTISGCYNKATVISADRAAGIVGNSYGNIYNCWNAGNIIGTGSSTRAAGIVGQLTCATSTEPREIKGCYNIGYVTCSGATYRGAVIGQQSTPATYSNCFWLKGTSATGIGKLPTAGVQIDATSADEMKTSEFVTLLNGDLDEPAWETSANDYPTLIAFAHKAAPETWVDLAKKPADLNIFDGSSAEKAIKITSPQELAWVAKQVNSKADNFQNKYLCLEKNIDLNNFPWKQIGYYVSSSDKSAFEGVFDGKGFTISNIFMQDSLECYTGLFGFAGGSSTTSAEIKNIGIESGNIASKKRTSCYVGGIAGYSYAKINSCYNKANITSNDRAGGIVGNNIGNVSNCWNSGTITCVSRAGGIAGTHSYISSSKGCTLKHCYNIGKVSSETAQSTTSYEGAIMGQQSNPSTNENNYWLSGTASQGMGRNTTAGQVQPTEKTEAEMKTVAFAAMLNGNQVNTYWIGNEGEYPILAVFNKTITNLPTGKEAESMKLIGEKGKLIVVNQGLTTTVTVYNVTGMQVASFISEKGTNSYPLAAGIYLVNGTKVSIR